MTPDFFTYHEMVRLHEKISIVLSHVIIVTWLVLILTLLLQLIMVPSFFSAIALELGVLTPALVIWCRT